MSTKEKEIKIDEKEGESKKEKKKEQGELFILRENLEKSFTNIQLGIIPIATLNQGKLFFCIKEGQRVIIKAHIIRQHGITSIELKTEKEDGQEELIEKKFVGQQNLDYDVMNIIRKNLYRIRKIEIPLHKNMPMINSRNASNRSITITKNNFAIYFNTLSFSWKYDDTFMAISDARTYSHNVTDDNAKKIYDTSELERYKREYLRPSSDNQKIDEIFRNESDLFVHEVGAQEIMGNVNNDFLHFTLLNKTVRKNKDKSNINTSVSKFEKIEVFGKMKEFFQNNIQKVGKKRFEVKTVSQRNEIYLIEVKVC